jgi:2'-5' RNA ligase
LGSADTNLIPKLEHGFTSAFSNAILPNVTLKGVGAFPSSERPRVVWAGIQKGIEELKVLQQRVYKITVPLGFVAETRPFSPHVTLGRVKYVPKGGTLTRVLDLFSENYEAQCCINTVHLVKSELKSSGPIYTTLATFPVRDNNSQKNKEGI